MKHIVHLTTVHSPFDTRIFQKECRSLVEQGYRVSLVAPHSDCETVGGVDIVAIPGLNDRLARRTRFTRGVVSLYRVARQLRADLYHFHDPELMPVTLLLKLATDARVIYDVHENHSKKIPAREWFPSALGGLTSVTVKGLECLTASAVDGIVAATEHIGAQFPPHKTSVVKNYPLLSMVGTTPASDRDYEDNWDLIYTGGFTNHRGLVQIVQALEHVKTPQARLILLGRAVDRRAEDLTRRLAGFRRVDYRGMIPYEQMYRCLRTAAIGLVCNQPVHDYQLAQPNKLFEYMSAGLPVIASDFNLWREVVEGNECGVTVDSTSPQQIADAIDYLLQHPGVRRRMGANGVTAILENYNWEQESTELLRLYQELLS